MPKGARARWIENGVMPYVREPMLWPVLLVVIAHVVAGIAPLLIFAVRDGSRASTATLIVLGAATLLGIGMELRGRRRPGTLSVILLATWLASVGGAFLSLRYNLF